MIELHLGDCLQYMKSMPDKSVDAVITDPPYGVDMLRGDSRVKGRLYGDKTPPDIRWISDYPAIVWGREQLESLPYKWDLTS
jgi:DNA modification methylase